MMVSELAAEHQRHTRTYRRHQVLLLVNRGDVGTVCFLADDLVRRAAREGETGLVSDDARESGRLAAAHDAHWNPVWVLLTDPLSLSLALLCGRGGEGRG